MTIYALSSGPGLSGLAVIRVSGEGALNIIQKITNEQIPTPRVATLRNLRKFDSDEIIDRGIILWFPGPRSYTGEDLIELHIHGSLAVINEIQNTLSIVACIAAV